LLCRVSARVTKWAGWWTLPGGGVDFGEDPKAAMVREVREETGLEVRSAGVAGVDSLVVPAAARTTHSLRIIYFTEILGGALTNEVNGSTDLCEWHDLEAVSSIRAVGLVDTALSLL
jgi:ADP-ribose pyrophosphatase YjhB (NUDIX family)